MSDPQYLCCGPWAQGWGESPAAALRAARRQQRFPSRGHWTTYRVDPRTEARFPSSIMWPKDAPAPTIVDIRDARMHRMPLPADRTLAAD